MAHIYRNQVERVAEELGKLTFSEMMTAADIIRDAILDQIKIEDGGVIFDTPTLASILSGFASDFNDAYEHRRIEGID